MSTTSIVTRGAIVAAAISLAALGPITAGASASGLYVALGDSISRGDGAPPGRGFVDLYYAHLQEPASGGLDQLANLAVAGETSTSMLGPDGQLDEAMFAIEQQSDTKVVTLGMGGNDGVAGDCPVGYNAPPCPFGANYLQIMEVLTDVLEHDSGAETIQVLEYYNPASGAGTAAESTLDFALLGVDGRIDCAGSGPGLGLNDLVACIGRDFGVTPVDAYPTFKAGGRALMADGLHPNETGHAYIACLFEHPERAGSANPCEETPPPAHEVDTQAPTVGLSGPSRQRLLRRRGLSRAKRSSSPSTSSSRPR